MEPGPLIILSGPAGSGKSTVIRRLLQDAEMGLRKSISVTTRAPRQGERNGEDYLFWTREQFEEEKVAGGFVEWAQVHDHYYGTPRSEIDPYRAQGIGVILVIDVQGAAQVRRKYPDALSVFLKAPLWEDYRQRMLLRGDEDEAAIARRLETARRELERAGEYDAVLENDQVDTTVAQLRDLVARRFLGGKHA